MRVVPDGVEVVASVAEAGRLPLPPLLVLEPLVDFLDSRGLGRGPVRWERIGEGQSNVTYLLGRGPDEFVLRRGPRPPHPKSAHDMVREARIQRMVRDQGFPVPEILAVCEDLAVLGVPFYVMSFVRGTVITDTIPGHLDSPEARRATSLELVDTLVRLHQIDTSHAGLAAFGRPEGYLRRQVERFATLWDGNTTRDLPAVGELADWLMRNLPESQANAVIHGDYRLGNLMFASDLPPRVSAVLDWEMATVGDPLADLGYLTATYAEHGSIRTPLDLSPVTREPGYLTRDELTTRYRERMGLDIQALPWYEALALWKAAVFCEAIYTRWLRGERPHDTTFAPLLESGVPGLLEAARACVERS